MTLNNGVAPMYVYYVSGIPFGNELYHHGIKGQKWGVRRYQNEDGSLTPAGKERYGTVENYKAQTALQEAKKSKNKAARSMLNPFSKNRRQNAENYRNAVKDVEKKQKEADKSEKTWKQDLYKNEIARGRKMAKAGYDEAQEILRREFLDAKYNEIVERQQARIDRGEQFSREYDSDDTALSLIQYEADRIDERLNDYYLYKRWGS